MYHRITDSTPPRWGPWRYAVSTTSFERHAERIADRYQPVTLDRVVDALQGRDTLPERAAVVTFDDGYRDTHTKALPVLERVGIPATVYVSTALLGSDTGPLSFRLAAALQQRDTEQIDRHALPLSDLGPLPSDTTGAFEALYGALKFQSPGVRERALRVVEGQEAQGGATMLTREGLRALAAHETITIGAHGHEHCPLTVLSERPLREALADCRAELGAILDEDVQHFSYPYGARDDRVTRAVEAAGFESAVTTGPGYISLSHSQSDVYSLPRVDGSVFPP